MKRMFALLLIAMLALSVAACGSSKDEGLNGSGSGSQSAGNGALSGGAGSSEGGAASSNGATSGENGLTNGDGAPGGEKNGLTGGDAITGAGSDLENGMNSGAAATPQRGEALPGATYGQMLRNARVHDRDGFLKDGENAVTPGTIR